MFDDESEQFKGIDKRSLIGAPLKAAADAQELLSKAAADFVAGASMADTVISSDEKRNKEEPAMLLSNVKVSESAVDDANIILAGEVKVPESAGENR